MKERNNPAAPVNAASHPAATVDAVAGDEKFQQRAEQWTSTADRNFTNDEIAEKFTLRTQRVLDVLALKKPDQVPTNLMTVGYLLGFDNIKPKDAFYNYSKVLAAAEKLHREFDPEYSIVSNIHSGPTLDTLGLRLIRWPGSQVEGHAVDDGISHQYIEDEYMLEDEYDELIDNPEGFLLRTYLPRICSGLTGLAMLPNLFSLTELFGFTGTLASLGQGKPARAALDALLRAADLASETAANIAATQERIACTYGAPSFIGGVVFAPYDLVGDTMRCTRGITFDLYRRPEKVIAATEALIPMAVRMGTQAADESRNPFVFMPLHKGSDIFLSKEQFSTFYWPSLKATASALIDAGCIPVLFLEGPYHHRLEIIAADPLPSGKSIWIFSQIDMRLAKEKIGNWACIAGNVPASLFKQGSPQMLEDYCKNLILDCSADGGFFLFPGTILDQANPQNIRTYLDSGRKFSKAN